MILKTSKVSANRLQAVVIQHIAQNCHVLFCVLQCRRLSEQTDLLAYTLRTIPVESIADSGESAQTCSVSPESMRIRERDATESLVSCIGDFKRAVHTQKDSTEKALNLSAVIELLKQYKLLIGMKRLLQN